MESYESYNVLDVIYNYLEIYGYMNPVVESLFKWFSNDDIVEWFYKDYCENDNEYVKERFEEEEAKAIIDYVNKHILGE